MKITMFKALALLAVALCSLPRPACPQSQSKTPPKAAELASTEPRKLELCELEEGTLKQTVTQLEDWLRGDNLPLMNIVFAPGTDQLKVPALTLRHVSGPDALRLIATAAGCEAEPIFGEKEPFGYTGPQTIGYILRALGGQTFLATPAGMGAYVKPPPPTRSGPKSAAAKPGPDRITTTLPQVKAGGPDGAVVSGTRNQPNALPSGRGFGGGEAPDPGGFDHGFGGAAGPGGSGVVGFGGGFPASNAEPVTRVYPLSTITTLIKFKEIEETLLEVLKSDGIKPDEAKIALHEKTNVMVVRGPQRVQELVAQLLESLIQNSREGRDQGTAQRLMRLEMELEAQVITNKRLQERLSMADEEARQYQRQIRELQDRLPQKLPQKQ